MRFMVLTAAALLSACGAGSEGANEARGATDDPGGTAEAPRILPTPNSIEANANAPGGAPAGPASEEQWIGRFAVTSEMCRGGAWDIGQTRIVTDSGTACDIDRVGRAAQQVTLRLACSSEGAATGEDWVLTPAGRDRLKVERNAKGERVNVDLIRCS